MTDEELNKMIGEFLPYPADGQHYALKQFAALVAAAEREACAKVCEEAHWSLDDRNEYAAAIRARGAGMTDKELLQQALDALKHLCLYTSAIKGYDGHKVQPTIKAIKARLTKPEPAECDGGQCGIGGYCKECPKPLVKLKEMLEVQGRNGTWNYDPYFHGMYNGMEVMLAVLEGREPVFREAPKKWLSKKEWVGLTDEEVKILTTQNRTDFSRPPYEEFYRAIEAKLKEKNSG